MAFIINWRDITPSVYHNSAVVWGLLRPIGHTGQMGAEGINCLQKLQGIARHALQGRKTSDYHHHNCLEQAYYILSGRGEVLIGDKRYPTEEGDAVYLPSGLSHQMFNDGEMWIEHHVISAKVVEDGGEPVICNWRNVNPQTDGEGAIRWHLLGSETNSDEPRLSCLRGMHMIDREAVQPRKHSKEASAGKMELVYYVLAGKGTTIIDGIEHPITEGDIIHLPPGTSYYFLNDSSDWLESLIISVAKMNFSVIEFAPPSTSTNKNAVSSDFKDNIS